MSSAGTLSAQAAKETPPPPAPAKSFRMPPRRTITLGNGMQVTFADDTDLCVAYHLVRSNRLYGYEDCPPYEDRVTGRDPPFKYDDSL